jgi:type 1 glutamine amidotransferase
MKAKGRGEEGKRQKAKGEKSAVLCLLFLLTSIFSGAVQVQGQDASQKPEFQRAPDAIERVTWRTRTLVGDDRLTNWNFAIATQTLGGLTFHEGVVRTEAAVVDFVEGASTQKVSPQLQKNLDYNLTSAERAHLKTSMGPVRLLAYRVHLFSSDAAERRKQFEFARDMNVDTMVVGGGAQGRTLTTPDLAALDALAAEFNINVAVAGEPRAMMKALEGRSDRIGVTLSTAQPIPREILDATAKRLKYVSLGGPGMTADFFHELNRLNVRPLALALDAGGTEVPPSKTAGTQVAASKIDLFRAVEAFEAAVQPAYGAHFTAFSRSRPIRRDLVRPAKGETLSDAERARRSEEMLQKIRAAVPAKPYAAPKTPRKLLVIESLQGMSHDTIPHANVMLEEMGRITGAWTVEFNNDLNNLKYPKITEYDGVFLNSIVGEFAPDPAVRDGLLRFVREGGGVGGVHGTPWASRNWDEFGVVFGAKSAPHRIEQGVMKVYDAGSPIIKPFGSQPLPFREEYYRFEHQGMNQLRWEDVRVLLTVDLDDPKIEPRPWTGYKRPDNIYPVTWIRRYGKGRMFYSSLGHMAETFTTPEIVGHFLAGVQFLLGDLDADTTPNPRSAASSASTPSSPPTPSTQAAAPAAAPIQSISQRPNGSSLGTIRVGAADNNIWFGWRVGVPIGALKPLTISDALEKIDVLSVANVEASAKDIVSFEVPKPLDQRLQPGERAAVVRRFRELNEQLLAYRVDNLPSDSATRRQVVEFAKSINAPLIIIDARTTNLDEIDALAQASGINVAIESRQDPKPVMALLDGRSKHMGLAADLTSWVQSGVKPVEALSAVKDRLMVVTVSPLAGGTSVLENFFLAAYRAGIKPLSISVQSPGVREPELVNTLNAFERVMWPAMAERVRSMLASPAGQIRGPDRLEADMRQQITAAAPRQALAKPRKPRKLLVTDIQMYSGHGTIPHGHLLLELIGRQTGAFEPVFSNDLNLLKYPKIKEFDAVYLNNVCGMVHNDPDVREGILRFVREGGGIGGHHAVTYANNNWPEFAELMGGWAGAHHIERQMIKVDDAGSPLTKSFGSASFEHTDEFYIFPPSSPYSREKQRVLLSIDVEKSDRATEGRLCAQCTRPDQDYGLAWIKTYGKGRAYFTPLGHTPIFYTDPRWTQHLLAALQYILGDLDADATPNPRSGTRD